VPDVFKEGVHGALFDPHDAKSAAAAIQRAILGGEVMKNASYAHGKAFSWEKSVRELEQTLRDVAERKAMVDGWW
jgi:glycosyltransferase involved in cell wall biosynthesis